MLSICAFDDRASLIGAKLLILSLEKHCRDFTLYLGFTDENPAFNDWLSRHGPHVIMVEMPRVADVCLKHIKPLLFLELFRRGVDDVTWLDTDVLVLRDIEPEIRRLGSDCVAVTEDINSFVPQTNLRAHYHMSPVRDLPGCVNSCMVRFTSAHVPLLEKWLDFMRDPVFLEQWNKPLGERLWGFGLDQTVLQVLLCCRGENWTPPSSVAFWKSGPDVIQEWGVRTYKPWDRIKATLGWNRPFALHLIGYEKPWTAFSRIHRHRWASVFCTMAQPYAAETEEDLSWAFPTSLGAKMAQWFSLGQPHLVGFWHGLAARVWRFFRARIGPKPIPASPANGSQEEIGETDRDRLSYSP